MKGARKRLNSMILLNDLEKRLNEYMREPLYGNTANQLHSFIETYLEHVRNKRGICDYKVDVSPGDRGDSLKVDITIKPHRAAEFIDLKATIGSNIPTPEWLVSDFCKPVKNCIVCVCCHQMCEEGRSFYERNKDDDRDY